MMHFGMSGRGQGMQGLGKSFSAGTMGQIRAGMAEVAGEVPVSSL